MATTLDDVVITDAWEDLVDTHASLAGAAATIQNQGPGPVAIVYGGGAAPTNKSGIMLGVRETATGSSANVWARAINSQGLVSVTLS